MAFKSYNNTQTSTNSLRRASDAIPNMNPWTALAKASINGVAEYFDSLTQKRQLEQQSSMYMFEAMNHIYNAQLTDLDIELAKGDVRLATNEVYNTYRMGEVGAMEQGLQDQQAIHTRRAQNASSGVKMGEGSKSELVTAESLSAAINQYIIQQNTNNNAKAAMSQVYSHMKTASNLELQKANYMAQSWIAIGDSLAAKTMADSISPLENSIYAFGSSFGASSAGSKFGGK